MQRPGGKHLLMNTLHIITWLLNLLRPTDPVSVRDQSDEAGLPWGERAAAPPRRLPEREAGQEEHGALTRRPSVSNLALFPPVPWRNDSLYILDLLSLLYPAAVPASWFKLHRRMEKKKKITCSHVQIKHFIGEVKLCCRTWRGGGGRGGFKTDNKNCWKHNVAVIVINNMTPSDFHFPSVFRSETPSSVSLILNPRLAKLTAARQHMKCF